MSSDSSAQPVVAPGFMYIVKLGDYTHVLQAADQASSGYLNLTQFVIRDVNVARNLLVERGPFLLSEKQQKMDEVITDNEEAINRVVKILQPARVEQISTDSIRFNTTNPWALTDSPKSAATFGRLQHTYSKLKTVVHDLKNIEATAQLDDCATRAITNVDAAPETPVDTDPRRPSLSDTLSPRTPVDGHQLLTWKRSRRSNRYGPNSNVSSISGHTADEDQEVNDLLSPLSVNGKVPNPQSDAVAQASQEPVSAPTPPLPPTQEDISLEPVVEPQADRLPVIHELEDASFVQLGPVRPVESKPEKENATTVNAEAEATNGQTQGPPSGIVSSHEQIKSPATPARNFSSPPPDAASSLPSATPNRVSSPPTTRPGSRMRRDTFEDMRRRDRLLNRLPTEEQDQFKPMSPVTQQQGWPAVRQDTNRDRPDYAGRFPSLYAGPAEDRVMTPTPSLPFNGHSVRQTQYQNREGVSSQHQASEVRPSPPESRVAEPLQSTTSERSSFLGGWRTSSRRQSRLNHEQENQQKTPGPSWSAKHATYPPIKTEQELRPVNETVGDNSLPPSNNVFSPTRTQLSPQEQLQSPEDANSGNRPQAPPHQRNPQIFQIDPELTRLPSLLRAAHTRPQVAIRPDSHTSETNPDRRDELYFSEDRLAHWSNNPLNRSTTAPPLGNQASTDIDQKLPDPVAGNDHLHQRSMSDTSVPQINVTRVPTVPRKPVPYQNSASSSRNHSPHEVSRINTPVQKRPQSEMLTSEFMPSGMTKDASGPPSPIHEERRASLALPRSSGVSTHSLSVHAQSSGETSRRSSVSVEESTNKRLSSSERTAPTPEQTIPIPIPIPEQATPTQNSTTIAVEDAVPVQNRMSLNNPLAMHPPDIPIRQQSAYQVQPNVHTNFPVQAPRLQTNIPPQAVAPVTQPDYRSPAFQQSRTYFDPGHNIHLGQASPPSAQTPSRFRDQDQMRLPSAQPSHTRTEPPVSLADGVLVQGPENSRRASEQHAKNSFLHRQTASMLAQAQHATNIHPPNSHLPPTNVQPPVNSQQPPNDSHAMRNPQTPMVASHGPMTPQPAVRVITQQQGPPRLILTPQKAIDMSRPIAPPNVPTTNATYPPQRVLVDATIPNGAMNHQSPTRQQLPNNKDKQTASEPQIVQIMADKRQISPQAVVAQKQIQGEQLLKPCVCEDESSIRENSYNASGVRRGEDGPVLEEPQKVPGPSYSIREEPANSSSSAAAQATPRAKKKTSWLKHQASRMAGRERE